MSAEAPVELRGPFEVQAERDDHPAPSEELPGRQYDCSHYERCLSLAASLNWESFTCNSCAGLPNENLLWRARTNARKDTLAARFLNAPPPEIVQGTVPQRPEEKISEAARCQESS